MKALHDSIGQELRWVHSRVLSSDYELREGDEVFARLSSKGACTGQVRAEVEDGSWIIERRGIRQSITVLARDTETELATMKRGRSGQATLHFHDGREYRWQHTSFWRDVWSWVNNEGTPLLSISRGVRVHLEPTAQALPDLALLAVLGWYLHKQQEEAASFAAIIPIIAS